MRTTRYSTAKTPDFVDRDSFSFAIKHLASAFEDRLRKIEQNQASIASFINKNFALFYDSLTAGKTPLLTSTTNNESSTS